MLALLRRSLAVALLAALALLGTTPVPASASPATCDGVWVVVQSDQEDAGTAHASCATTFDTGLAALKSAGYNTEFAKSVLNRIDGLPKDTDFNTNGGYYWSYWNAPVTADGTLGAWTYYQVGPDSSKPAVGTAEGWLLTNEKNATGPALAALPEATASPRVVASSPAAAASSGSPTGLIVAGVVVLVALLGLGGWWLLRGRRG